MKQVFTICFCFEQRDFSFPKGNKIKWLHLCICPLFHPTLPKRCVEWFCDTSLSFPTSWNCQFLKFSFWSIKMACHHPTSAPFSLLSSSPFTWLLYSPFQVHVPFLLYPILPHHLLGDMAIFMAQIQDYVPSLLFWFLILLSLKEVTQLFKLWILIPLIYSSSGNLRLSLRPGNQPGSAEGDTGGLALLPPGRTLNLPVTSTTTSRKNAKW